MLVQFGTDIDRSGLDGLEKHFCYTWLFDVDEVGLEHALGGFKALRADLDSTAIGELGDVRICQGSVMSSGPGRFQRGLWFLRKGAYRVRGRNYIVNSDGSYNQHE